MKILKDIIMLVCLSISVWFMLSVLVIIVFSLAFEMIPSNPNYQVLLNHMFGIVKLMCVPAVIISKYIKDKNEEIIV